MKISPEKLFGAGNSKMTKFFPKMGRIGVGKSPLPAWEIRLQALGNPAPLESGATPQGSGISSSNGAGLGIWRISGSDRTLEILKISNLAEGLCSWRVYSLISTKGRDLEGGLRATEYVDKLYMVG